MDELHSVIENVKRLQRLETLKEIMELVAEVQRDAGELSVFEYRLSQRCVEAMHEVKL